MYNDWVLVDRFLYAFFFIKDRGKLTMKVGVVGACRGGSIVAYVLIMLGVGREIVLVDIDQNRAESEASPLMRYIFPIRSMYMREGMKS